MDSKAVTAGEAATVFAMTTYVIGVLLMFIGALCGFRNVGTMSAGSKFGMSVLMGMVWPAIAVDAAAKYAYGSMTEGATLDPDDLAIYDGEKWNQSEMNDEPTAGIDINPTATELRWYGDTWDEPWSMFARSTDGHVVLKAPDGEEWDMTEITAGKLTPDAFGLIGDSPST